MVQLRNKKICALPLENAMSTESLSEAEAFYQFLGNRLKVRESEESLEQLLEIWRNRQEYLQTVETVQEGVRDMEAGRMSPLRELLDKLPTDSASQPSDS